jgi:DNA-binding transcriptional ArsR family regulator
MDLDLDGWEPEPRRTRAEIQCVDGSAADPRSPHLTIARYNRMVVSMQIAAPDFDRMFGALADATRRDIVRRAIDEQEGVAQLAEHYPMSFAAVQKHIAILERAGLVTKERIGRRKVVRANVEGLRIARRLLDQYEELWRGRIDRMATLIIEDTKESQP